MKRLASLLLAVLMLLPAFACFAFAGGNEPNAQPVALDEDKGTNIASQANLGSYSIQSTGEKKYVDIELTDEKVDFYRLIDGDKESGSFTNRTNNYVLELTYDKPYYFTDIVINVNGSGKQPSGALVEESYALDKIVVSVYKSNEIVYTETVSTTGLTEVVVSANTAADKIEIYRDQSSLATKERGNDFFREIETFMIEKEFCDVVKSNIASEAYIYGTGTNEGDYCDNWWAWSPKALVDGKIDVGTRSPKGWNYSIVLEFTKDYLISELNLHLNGKGELANSGSVEEVLMNISQIRVRLFNMEGDQVYDSKDVPVDSTNVKLDPFVEASKIKIEIANGKGDGSEFMWEIETFVEEGNHIFEKTGESNPTCNRPGYLEYSCDCGKVIKKAVPATGFHQYDEGVVTTPATETVNGVLTKRCIACGETKDYDIPATAHNWDDGVVTAPDCDSEGSTLYSCKGCAIENCDATYVTDIKDALGHDWDDGVVIRKASTVSYGQKKLTCMRDGCGETTIKQTRKLLYTDSVADFEFIKGNYQVEVDINEDDSLYNPNPKEYGVLGEDSYEAIVDSDPLTYWYGTTGSTYTIVFDREYVFTKAVMYASGNNTTFKVEWINADDEVTAVYTTKWNTVGVLDKNNPISVDMSESLTGGAKAAKIRVTPTGAKWENGWAMSFHGLDLVAHDCKVDASDYILSGDKYVKPTCTTDGSCIAKCPVCSNEINVTLPKEEYGHNVPTIIPDLEATCSTPGYGHGECVDCKQTIENLEIPALGTHVYDTEIVFMEAKCGAIGIRQIVCKGCGRVGSQFPIASTNVHTNHWAQDYVPTYTDTGKEIYVCSGCGLPADDNGVSEKEIAKKVLSSEFLSFVGYSVRTTGYAGIRLTYKIDMEMLAEIEYECDVRIITYVTNKDGVTKSVESYGKYSQDRYSDDGEFSVVIKPSSYYDEYEVKTVVRLMNFRGIEYVDFDLGELATDDNGKISLCEVAENVLATSKYLGDKEKEFYESIVAGK
ncbi:MAG: hypothetical protein IJC80_05400 [Clostridia bacterium]|nr:hypothetical protein [Clostridia bacterium]